MNFSKTTFKEAVERVITDQRGRLSRLVKYTNGGAKALIKHCVHADSKTSYDKAMEFLDWLTTLYMYTQVYTSASEARTRFREWCICS